MQLRAQSCVLPPPPRRAGQPSVRARLRSARTGERREGDRDARSSPAVGALDLLRCASPKTSNSTHHPSHGLAPLASSASLIQTSSSCPSSQAFPASLAASSPPPLRAARAEAENHPSAEETAAGAACASVAAAPGRRVGEAEGAAGEAARGPLLSGVVGCRRGREDDAGGGEGSGVG